MPTEAPGQTTLSLLAVLGAHIRLIAGCVGLSLVLATLYLFCATRVYRATSTLLLDNGLVPARGDAGGISENYIQTRAEELRSQAVLRRAADSADFAGMASFADVRGDVVKALQKSTSLSITPAHRSDVISISLESPYPDEAAKVVDAIVNAYIDSRAQLHRSGGGIVATVVDQERAALEKRRTECQVELAELSKQTGAIGTGVAGTNPDVQRGSKISDAATTAQVRQLELQARRDALAEALNSPERRSAYVQSLQSRGRDSGDPTYGNLRQQLMTIELNRAAMLPSLGEHHSRVLAADKAIENLKQQIKDYELSIVRADLQTLETETTANESNLAQLNTLESRQRYVTSAGVPSSARQEQLIGELSRIERQAALLDERAATSRIDSALGESNDARVLEPAQVGDKPVFPQKAMTLAIALLAGTIVGSSLAFVREGTRARLRSAEDITPQYGARVLALVPRMSNNTSPLARGLIVRLDPQGAAAEAFRTMRIMLHLGTSKVPKTILIASPAGGDGKSTTASNLAIAFAQAGERTLLIDGDFRGPVQHLIFELDPESGLSTALSGDGPADVAIQASGIDRLDVLPCGPFAGHPSELLGSERFSRMLTALSHSYERIVIDSPPLGPTPDAAILAALADATVLVVRVNRSVLRVIDQAVSSLLNVNANLVGVVANDIQDRNGGYRDESWQYSAHSRRFVLHPNKAPAELPLEAHIDQPGNGQIHSQANGLVDPRVDGHSDPRIEPHAMTSQS